MLKRIVFDPKPQLFPHNDPSTLRDAYDWAYGTIHSRGHSGGAATAVDGTPLFAVIPFLDTMNHANSAGGVTGDLAQVPITTEDGGEEDAMKLLSNRDYSAGEELYVSYDNTTGCHVKMLSMYGFTDPHERRDCFHLSVHPAEILDEPLAVDEDYRYHLLQEQGLAGGYDIGGLARGRPLMWSLHYNEMPTSALAVIRILRLPPVDRLRPELLRTLQGHDFDAKSAIEGVNEAQVWAQLGKAVQDSLTFFEDGHNEQQVRYYCASIVI